MAIAFDAATDGAAGVGTTRSWNHTCSGNNRYLFVATGGTTVSDVVTGVTYNLVAMTKLGVILPPSGRYLTLWGLANPASGSNQVVATASSSILLAGMSASYTGADAFELSATNTAASPATGVTGTVTTQRPNAWTIATFSADAGGTISAGSGTTSRVTNSSGMFALMDSNASLTPGSNTLQVSGGAADWGVVIASLAPVVQASVGAYSWTGVTATTSQLISAGVGAYSWAGTTASTTQLTNAIPGTWGWAGTTSGVIQAGLVSLIPGAYSWAGTSASFGTNAIVPGVMPNVVGVNLQQATTYLIQARIAPDNGALPNGSFTVVGYFDKWPVTISWVKGSKPGIVLAQTPAAGLPAAFNTPVTLTVASFPFSVADKYSAGGYS